MAKGLLPLGQPESKNHAPWGYKVPAPSPHIRVSLQSILAPQSPRGVKGPPLRMPCSSFSLPNLFLFRGHLYLRASFLGNPVCDNWPLSTEFEPSGFYPTDKQFCNCNFKPSLVRATNWSSQSEM